MPTIPERRIRRAAVVASAVAGLILVAGGTALASPSGRIEAARNATAAYHDLSAAEADGFGPFYVCTDQDGAGAMGQHFVNGARVADPSLDETRPEALVYAPTPGGGLRLVGVEYVVIAADWDALHASPPELYGRQLKRVPAGNRYGLPDFYELHAWIWRPNPRGMFDDWNSKVSCLGNGDPA
jgi:hypothetical protein